MKNMFTITELTLNKIWGYIYVTEILTPKTLVYSKYISNCFLKENKIMGQNSKLFCTPCTR